MPSTKVPKFCTFCCNSSGSECYPLLLTCVVPIKYSNNETKPLTAEKRCVSSKTKDAVIFADFIVKGRWKWPIKWYFKYTLVITHIVHSKLISISHKDTTA